MKKFLGLCLVAVVALSSLPVQAQTRSIHKAGLLWEISGNGLKEPSYLFGTYHLAGKSFLDTLPRIMKQLLRSKIVVGEIVVESQLEMSQKLMPMMLLKENTLDRILSRKEFAEVDSFIGAKTPMKLSMLNNMKPVAVQLLLVTMLAPQDVSANNPALDLYFQSEARKAGKAVLGFETVEEQANLLLNNPIERQKKLLLKTVRESDRMLRVSKEIFQYYKHQDLAKIEKEFLVNNDYTPQEMNELVQKRNHNWLKKMPELMEKGSVFFAVGAGHLVGKEGLIKLLENKGYQLRPLATR
jgi:uncharacterized protein